MEKLSAVIIALNEEKNLARCLPPLKRVADEIVVIDSFSTDGTLEVCRQMGVRVVQHAFVDYVGQHRFADTQATYDLILSIDADEVLSEKLISSINEVKKNRQFDGYFMNRMANYCGKWIHHSGWYPDRKLRLYDRRKGSWQGIIIHEYFQLTPEAEVGFLKGNLLHYSYYSIEQHRRRVEKFTSLMAESYFEQGVKVPALRIWLSPAAKFVRCYFLKLGFLDGKAGWRICTISAEATYKKYLKLRKLYKQKRQNR